MKNIISAAEASYHYSTAHTAHYEQKDLRRAVDLYMKVMRLHPDSKEAGFSHSQILNIANSVVPKEALLDAQMKLVIAHLGEGSETSAEPPPAEQPATDPSEGTR